MVKERLQISKHWCIGELCACLKSCVILLNYPIRADFVLYGENAK